MKMHGFRTRHLDVATTEHARPGTIVASWSTRTAASMLAVILIFGTTRSTRADSIPVTILDPTLQVTTALSDLNQPIGIVFLGSVNDYLVLEKASGLIKRVINGVVQATPVLDLAVNSNSERGLLSLALHPGFPNTPFMYVRWTESSTGADSTVVS